MRYLVDLARDWGIALVVVVAAFFTWQFISSPPVPTVGPAPDFELSDLEGGSVKLSDYGDQLVVLNFWFTDCMPCRREIPELQAFAMANPDVPVIGISTDRMDPAILRTRSRQLGVGYRVAHDRYGQVAGTYGVNVFPTTMIVREGEIRNIRIGELDRALLASMVERSR